ncbi:MAG TPA: pyridoxal-phosphate dependent enzyme, partial [Sphingomonadales bacterium]|nr:pyridoxal-phosphate dependent enzyme [Sphingomonadales bacterium]
GIAVAAKALKPALKVYGVQSEVYPAMKAALEGRTIAPTRQTVAEGIAVKEPGKLTRKVVAALVEDILIVTETQIERAINMFIEVEKVVVEGAGSATLAALLQYPGLFKGQKVGLVLSGGNIDPKILAFALMRGLVRDGRISRLRVTTPDLPGSLAKLTAIVASEGGNVIEVYHQRQFADIALKYTDIELVLETKDAGHMDRIVKALEAVGFEVERLAYAQH